MAVSQNCVWNVPRCSGRMERRGFVTGLDPDLWNVMKYRLYINKNLYAIHYTSIKIYMYAVYLYIIYISRICTLKLLTLAAAHFHFSSARHPCCTPVQRRFACMASARALARTQPVARVIHWLLCEAVHSAWDLLLLKLRGPYGVDCVPA